MALLNFPGDKRPVDVKSLGFKVPGYVRIMVEILSAFLGMFAAYEIYSLPAFLLQLAITVISFFLDYPRWRWMLGRGSQPDFVIYVHKKS